MGAAKTNARIFSWGSRALYAGPAFNLSAHRVGVTVLCCGVAGPLEIAHDPRRPATGWISCRTLLIPAGSIHLVRFLAEPIVCLYLDPQSADSERIAMGMKRRHRTFAIEHIRESKLVDVLNKVMRNELPAEEMPRQLTPLLDLPKATASDERVDRVVAKMRAAPGEPHSLAELARAVSLSPSRLQHLFKDVTGVPVRRFRVWNRMGAAIAAAAAGLSLTDAAHQAGFSSAAHFSSAFRAMFGLAPSDLVRAQLEITPLNPRS